MKILADCQKYHNKAAIKKKRPPLDIIDIIINRGKFNSNAPLAIVINLYGNGVKPPPSTIKTP